MGFRHFGFYSEISFQKGGVKGRKSLEENKR